MTDAQTAPLPYHHTQIGYPVLAGMAFGTLTQVRAWLRDKRAGRPRRWLYAPAGGLRRADAGFLAAHRGGRRDARLGRLWRRAGEATIRGALHRSRERRQDVVARGLGHPSHSAGLALQRLGPRRGPAQLR